jgi:phospholipase/lecithinase/hemolysin
MSLKVLRRVVALVTASISIAAAASPYTSIAVFGDSLSDGGNAYLYTEALFGPGNGFPPAPYAQNFSNGPVAVNQLAAKLGLSLTPSLAGGSNYAYGGAETGFQNYLRFNANPFVAGAFAGNNTGVLAQIASVPFGSIDASTLVVLWAGANDVFSSLSSDPTGASLPTTLFSALGNLQASVLALYADGARTILLPNMPDIGKTPFGIGLGPAAAASLTGAVQGFDAGLSALDLALEAALPGLDIIDFDTFGALNEVIAHPATYGLSNVTDACLSSAACNPNTYLFWDSVHPTTLVDGVLANGFAAAVPEPPMTALVVLALVAAAASRRRRP